MSMIFAMKSIQRLLAAMALVGLVLAQTSSTTYTATHTYAAIGTYTATASAIDSATNYNLAQAIATIGSNQTGLPNVFLLLTPSPSSPGGSIGNPPIAVTADVSSNAACTTTIAVNWGDGTQTVGSSSTHTYQVGGPYTVTASVTDCLGNTGLALNSFIVGPLSAINGIQVILPVFHANMGTDVYTPMRVYAVVTSATAVVSVNINVDGIVVYTTPTANAVGGSLYVMDKYLPEVVGTTHIITVTGYMSDGSTVSTTIQVRVTGVIN